MKIGFIGGGQMCEALVKGLISHELNFELSISEKVEERVEALRRMFPMARITSSNADILHSSDIIVIAVKPQQLKTAFEDADIPRGKLFISICAGVTLSQLASYITPLERIARVMPNLSAVVGEGAAGFALNANCAQEDARIVKKILSSVGAVVEQVPESLIDVVTGVSGSGPAYVCVFIEALADAGVKHGLSREAALRLAAQTCVGTGKMVLRGGEANHPAVIKDKVCSPGGTSIAGVSELEANGFRSSIFAAVSAAVERGRQLGGA